MRERKPPPGYYSRKIKRMHGWEFILIELALPLKTEAEIEKQLRQSEQLAARLLIASMASK